MRRPADLITYLSLILTVTCVSQLDNAIVGLPVISCERDQIRVELETEKPFRGRIYVRGEFRNSNCVRNYVDGKQIPVFPGDEKELHSDRRSGTDQFHEAPPSFRGREGISRNNPTERERNLAEGRIAEPAQSQTSQAGNSQGGGHRNEGTDQDDPLTRGSIPQPNGKLPAGGKDESAGGDSSQSPPKTPGSTHGNGAIPQQPGIPTVSPIDSDTASSDSTWKGVGGARPPSNGYTPVLSSNQEKIPKGKDSANHSGLEKDPQFHIFNRKFDGGSSNSKQSIVLSSEAMQYPGPQGFTETNCKQTCDPCACDKVEERHRRDTNRVELVVPVGACNAKRDRTLNPPSMITSFVAVVSFHDHFVTKLDRAYRVQCAYTETSRPVYTELNVSMSAASNLTNSVAPPDCKYLITGQDGAPITSVKVSDLVTHTWDCQSPVQEMFKMLVHSCFVEDGAGERFKVVDEHGCSTDEYLIRTPTYASDKLTATVDAYAFKYPDKSALDVQCSIKFCAKLNDECEIVTPPQCSPSSLRRRRSAPVDDGDSLTLHSNSLTVLDNDGEGQPLALPSLAPPAPVEFCVSVAAFGALVSLSTFLSTVSLAVLVGHYIIKNSRY